MIELTNGAQVADTAIIAHVTAEIDGGYVRDRVTVTQYDDKMPVVAVSLMYQNQPYVPPNGAALNVRMRKTDGKGVYNPCIGADTDGVVYLAITQQMTAAHGNSAFTVEISVDGGVKNTPPIGIAINPNPVQEGQIESEDEFLTLQEILAQCQKYGQIVEANAANIQTVVDEMDAIKDAPAAAERAEAAAAEAEKSAAESKGFRKFYSAVVPDANGNLDPSRPMTVGPAASVEIESAGDRIQSVTALGFTTQAGTGDPSPSNVRQLTNGGVKLVAVTFDGSSDEDWKFDAASTGAKRYYIFTENAAQADAATGFAVASRLKLAATGATTNPALFNIFTIASDNAIYVRTNNESLADFKSKLAADPLTVWYATTDGTGSLYAPIILTSGEYRATCLELAAPLCDGDSVVSWVKSGCDVELTFDGSSDENWAVTENSNNVQYISVPLDYSISSGFKAVLAYCNRLAKVTPSSADANPTSLYTCSVFARFLGDLVIKINIGAASAEAAKRALAANPITIWLKSPNYTEADDIAVSLETHVRWALVADGSYNVDDSANLGDVTRGRYIVSSTFKAQTGYLDNCQCSHLKNGNRYNTNAQGFYVNQYPYLFIDNSLLSSANAAGVKAFLQSQNTQGTPVQIEYPLATPITYAHPAVVIEAATGDQLAYTVTGQSGGTVSVALKPFQDGGHAKTADNAQQLDGLTLAALQNLLVPVGYIFSWAPVGDGPDLSTPAKVAEYFGFGTWQAYGSGQVLVGVDSGQTEFAMPGKTGGEKTHQLTTQELPSFTPSPSGGGNWLCIGGTVAEITQGLAQPGTAWVGENIGSTGGQAIGGNQPHNNLQPYITVYRWQRVK